MEDLIVLVFKISKTLFLFLRKHTFCMCSWTCLFFISDLNLFSPLLERQARRGKHHGYNEIAPVSVLML